MPKTITIDIPEWVDEERLKKAIVEAISQSLYPKEISIDELRKILKINLRDLKEDLDIEIDVNIKELREKEKKRVI